MPRKRAPHQLSGGQQQRIALARALAPQPRLLLLDEPFSNLDVDLRERLAHEVRGILKDTGTTALFVTHDQLEAFALGDVIGVMQRGRLEQWDDAYALYHRPATRFVAQFIGHGVFTPAHIDRAAAADLGGCVQTALGALEDLQECPLPEAYPGGDCDVLLRADDIVHDDASAGEGAHRAQGLPRLGVPVHAAPGQRRTGAGARAVAPRPPGRRVDRHPRPGGPRGDLRRASRRHPLERATFTQASYSKPGRVLYWYGACMNKPGARMNAKLRVAGFIAVGALAGALATIQLQAFARSAAAPLPLEELQQLAAVFGMVKSDYVEQVDEKKLIGDAIAGMVAGLDPHSQYFDKKTLKEFREQTGGRFVGVGIEIGMEDGLVKVQSPIEGSPAFRAGIKCGDLITRIDETAVKGLSMDQAVKRMRGEPNTKVSLTIFRKSENRSFPVVITREEIRIQSVRAKMLEPGYAWLRVSQFQDRTVDDFVRKLEELYKQDPNLKGLVLDLRNDPGGLLDAAVAISAAFLPENVVVVTTNGQIAESKATFKAAPEFYARRAGNDPLKRLPAAVKSVPLVVLVNEGSASASEIVAGALQDHKRATIMGAQTFGKGSVQTVRPLSADTALKITTARYYTPSGKAIQAKGVVPDIWLDETAEGNVFAALRMREADLSKHLSGTDEKKEEARSKAREDARIKLEEQLAKQKEPPKPLPEFGTGEDFQLTQALNHLSKRPVIVSKTAVERKAEAEIN